MVDGMSARAWTGALLILTAALTGCAPLTAEQLAALQQQQRQQEIECQQRGAVLVSGSCVSRGGGA